MFLAAIGNFVASAVAEGLGLHLWRPSPGPPPGTGPFYIVALTVEYFIPQLCHITVPPLAFPFRGRWLGPSPARAETDEVLRQHYFFRQPKGHRQPRALTSPLYRRSRSGDSHQTRRGVAVKATRSFSAAYAMAGGLGFPCAVSGNSPRTLRWGGGEHKFRPYLQTPFSSTLYPSMYSLTALTPLEWK